MGKTVTFSFNTEYEGSGEAEIFTFEKLGIDENMDEKAVEKVLEKLFHAWVWNKFNISGGIVINED
ncbi:hypothetical protein FQ087_12315 [Sporosarcina sp. ANT_H38]|uniref:hypothetical protein n=1 Tax=Sporosarcina sp. ANT_H38 TaxID=2597358 RepID=UPI0011F16C05|nr:hypothetical protein [Sporosarcina sp. ANT_H38]KAA0955400.1 hypothetical protein FQ087_12315 [Sporosarcina sp. ANT_H38]